MSDTFTVTRSAFIAAPPEAIFPLIEDLHRWQAWSPWEKIDPAMQRTYSGAAKGPGAIYNWSGNNKAGEGRMEITGLEAPNSLDIKLDFTRPMKAHNTIAFKLDAKDGGTQVTWIMLGASNLMSKVMGLFFNMDKLVGGDFEKGLANLKAVTEAKA
jgi:hypothetical protein